MITFFILTLNQLKHFEYTFFKIAIKKKCCYLFLSKIFFLKNNLISSFFYNWWGGGCNSPYCIRLCLTLPYVWIDQFIYPFKAFLKIDMEKCMAERDPSSKSTSSPFSPRCIRLCRDEPRMSGSRAETRSRNRPKVTSLFLRQQWTTTAASVRPAPRPPARATTIGRRDEDVSCGGFARVSRAVYSLYAHTHREDDIHTHTRTGGPPPALAPGRAWAKSITH